MSDVRPLEREVMERISPEGGKRGKMFVSVALKAS
jgi:hypothetical protein